MHHVHQRVIPADEPDRAATSASSRLANAAIQAPAIALGQKSTPCVVTMHREELRQSWPTSSKVVVGIVRDLAAHRMGTWGVPQPVIDDVLVVVSEAMTNVFKHVKSGPVKLRLVHQGDGVLAEIWDSSPIAPAPRPIDPDTEGGMGLHIIAGLTANRCGHRWDAGGKTVYGLIPIP